MDLEALRTLIDLERTGSFSATAAARSVTQSAVSQRIRSLEGELRVTLVERGAGRKGVVLTPAGRLATDAARRIAEVDDRLRSELARMAELPEPEVLRIGTVYSMGLHSFTGVFEAFLARHPTVPLHVEYLRTDRVYEALRNGEIDCGVVACPQRRAGIDVVRLPPERMVVVAHPTNAFQQETLIPAECLSGGRFVVFDGRIPTRKLVDRWMQSVGIVPEIVGEFDNVETMKQKAVLGAGFAVLPEPTVRREVSDGRLAVLALDAPVLLRPTGLLLSKNRSASTVRDWFIRTALGESHAPER